MNKKFKKAMAAENQEEADASAELARLLAKDEQGDDLDDVRDRNAKQMEKHEEVIAEQQQVAADLRKAFELPVDHDVMEELEEFLGDIEK
jgi:hypothetical protein